jgi:hypothetical protein
MVTVLFDGKFMYNAVFNDTLQEKDFIDGLKKMGYIDGYSGGKSPDVYYASKHIVNTLPQDYVSELQEFKKEYTEFKQQICK